MVSHPGVGPHSPALRRGPAASGAAAAATPAPAPPPPRAPELSIGRAYQGAAPAVAVPALPGLPSVQQRAEATSLLAAIPDPISMAALARNTGSGPQLGWTGAAPNADVDLGSQPDALLHTGSARIIAQRTIGRAHPGAGCTEYLLAFKGHDEEESKWLTYSAIVECALCPCCPSMCGPMYVTGYGMVCECNV